MNNEVTFIEISIGQLPDWYLEDEGNYDVFLEEAIERKWHNNSEFQNAEIVVIYNYQTDNAIVKAYNDDGDLVFERDNHDYQYALDYAKAIR